MKRFPDEKLESLIPFDIVLVEVGTGLTKKSMFTTDPNSANLYYVIELPDEDPRTFASLIEYLYHGTIPGAREAAEVSKTLAQIWQSSGSLDLSLISAQLMKLAGLFRSLSQHSGLNMQKPTVQQIANEIDLSTISENLKNGERTTISALIANFNLLYNNALLFNGEGHNVTGWARAVRLRATRKLESLRGSSFQELPDSHLSKSSPEWEHMTGIAFAFAELCRLVGLAERFQSIDLANAGMDTVIKLHGIYRRNLVN